MADTNDNKQRTADTFKINWNAVNTYNYQASEYEPEAINKNKIEDFKKRIKRFGEISTLEEAKALADKILPTKMSKSRFKIGNAECIIINKPDQFRISFNSEYEFISYDFA